MVTGTSGLIKQGSGHAQPDGRQRHLGTRPSTPARCWSTRHRGGTIGDVSVNTGTTLGGSGTVSGISTTGATVSPGDSSTVTGILTDTGNVVLDANSTFAANYQRRAPAGHAITDQLQAGGTINLANATLSITLGSSFTPTAGEQFTILNNTGTAAITGTFAGLAEGAMLTVSGQQFSISYKGGTNGKSVVLTTLTSTTTTVSPVTTSPVSGQSVTLTATVVPTTGTGTPTGTVTVQAQRYDRPGSPGTLNSSGVATLATTKLTTGTQLDHGGLLGRHDLRHQHVVAAVSVTVAQASSTTTLTASPNPSLAGQTVTLTATVTAVSPGSGTPTGTVTFFSGTTQLGTGTLSSAWPRCTTATLPAGTSSITAVYSGDTNFTASTSAAVNQVVSLGDHDAHALGLEHQSLRPPADDADGDRLGGHRLGHAHRHRDLLGQQRHQPRPGHADQRRGHADGLHPPGRPGVDHGRLLGRLQLRRHDLRTARAW